ncbi:hypothetical protein AB4P95_01225 [Pseudomonas sp. A1437]|uniref:hypothetical protein n=1 Tax=unclassified Pseudomonas TaxID=196821 RepID=UPI003783AA8E
MISVHQFVWPYWNTPENSISTLWYIPTFVLGWYAAVSISALRKYINSVSAIFVAVLVILSLFFLVQDEQIPILGMPFYGWLQNKFIMLSFSWMLFLAFLADGRGFVGALMQTRFLEVWEHGAIQII